MPTLDDLRAVLQDRAELVGPPVSADQAGDNTVVGLRPVRAAASRRRRLVAALLSAAAVLAVIVGAATAAERFGRDDGNPATGIGAYPPRHMTWQFSIDDIAGWTVTRDQSRWWTDSSGTQGAWQQAAGIERVSDPRERAVYTYEPNPAGARFPGNPTGHAISVGRAIAVTVHGEQGWWVPGEHVDPNPPDTTLSPNPWEAAADTPEDLPSLVWRNHDASWSMLSGTIGFDPSTYSFDNQFARQAMFDMARAVSIRDSDESVTAPFVVDMDPKFRPLEISSVRGVACVDWTSWGGPGDGRPQPDVMVCRAPTAQLDGPALPNDDFLRCPGGGSSYCPLQRRDLGDGTALIIGVSDFVGADVLTAAQQRQVLDSADVSPAFAEPSTWLPV